MVNAELINETQRAALGDALSAAADSAASTLTGLLGRQVTLTPSGLSTVGLSEVPGAFGGSLAVSKLSLSAGASGAGSLVLAEKDAALLADLIIGQDGSAAPATLSELHLSAIGEVANQTVTAFIGGLSKALGKKFSASSSDVEVASDLSGQAKALGASVVLLDFDMSVEGAAPGRLAVVLSGAAASSITGGGAPAAAAAPAAGSGFSAANTFGGGASAGTASVQPAQMAAVGEGGLVGGGANLELLMDVPLQVTVELGRTHKTVREILAFGSGSVVELDKLAGEPVDILINERPIAKGEVVVIDENFGIRITEILAPRERVAL
jgi:flagellar motor switch protein FliN/FliY